MFTVRDAMQLPELRAGDPRLVAGAPHLDRPIRWVHVSELARLDHLLHGGELVLTTGLGLPDEPERLADYAIHLHEVGASGVVIELGTNFVEIPQALTDAAETHGLPMIELRRVVRFVDITQAVHSRLVNDQLDELLQSARVHEVFRTLAVEGAAPTEILEHAATLVGSPVVLENLSHQAMMVGAANHPLERVLDNWEARSRCAPPAQGPSHYPQSGLFVAPVGGHGASPGRVAMVVSAEPTPLERTVLTSAAAAIALASPDARPRVDVLSRAHGSLLSDLLHRTWSRAQDVGLRASGLGVPLDGRTLIGMAVRRRSASPGSPHHDTAMVRDAVRTVHPQALIGTTDNQDVKVVISVAPGSGADELSRRVARAIHASADPSGAFATMSIGAGRPCSSIVEVAASLRGASRAAEASLATHTSRPLATLDDIRLPGLMHLLRNDDRVQAFVERELGAILHHDALHGTDLVVTLDAWLSNGANKTVTAGQLFLSRPALYRRLAAIGNLLDVDLDDSDSRLSLHVALRTLEAVRADAAPPRTDGWR